MMDKPKSITDEELNRILMNPQQFYTLKLHEIIKELLRRRKADRWIPVGERLPEKSPASTYNSIEVEAIWNGSVYSPCHMDIATKYWYADSISIPDPTHWRPLPEPPEVIT